MHNFSIDEIFSIDSSEEFNSLVLKVFNYQAENNPVYKQYISYLHRKTSDVKTIMDIPFLPIEFFKTHKVISGDVKTERLFFSSGTTGFQRSMHHVSDISIYEKSFIASFEKFYGPIQDYCFLALLPNYMENESSSLIYMVDLLIKKSNNINSGFYLDNLESLSEKLSILGSSGKRIILIGVSYALIDLADKYPMQLSNTIVMETGGMKGKRKELTKNELHQYLSSRLGLSSIHSEYGMTELLSQAYSKGDGKFYCPPWMKIMIRDSYDPFSYIETNKTGCINVIDLANINSCSFIETRDLGKVSDDASFEILGRFDHSDIRGCNLLLSE